MQNTEVGGGSSFILTSLGNLYLDVIYRFCGFNGWCCLSGQRRTSLTPGCPDGAGPQPGWRRARFPSPSRGGWVVFFTQSSGEVLLYSSRRLQAGELCDSSYRCLDASAGQLPYRST